ncbi:hypothetical protein ACE1CI_06730 [Aerosakkonemataceae cyanobacterium BLCC-F50]|uniref:Hemerythrin n=1 Tax=Floridaenema flaviceps BLCC-F50 TaxID=3153642 RepID=A0ABV4XN08_9CYAN
MKVFLNMYLLKDGDRYPVIIKVLGAAHSQFINTLKEIKTELNQKGPSLLLAIKVNEELLDWFVNHIKKIDRELKACMNN